METHIADAWVFFLLSFMSFGGFLLTLIAIWCVIHICYRFAERQNSLLLPTPVNASGRRPFAGASRHTTVSLNTLRLRVSTTRWNARHDQLTAFLAKRGNTVTSALFKGTYNLGIILGIVGMIAALIVCMASVWLVFQEWLHAGDNIVTTGPALSKRMTTEVASNWGSYYSPSRLPAVKPLVSIRKYALFKL